MAEHCIFCKIVAREAPAQILYQDEYITAFQDLQPAAPVHILIVPNHHIAALNDAGDDDAHWLGRTLLAAQQLARQYGMDQSGYRVVINTGADAGQTVFHLHIHLMGGRPLARLVR
jgi:histidine triad (HIT) family protein